MVKHFFISRSDIVSLFVQLNEFFHIYSALVIRLSFDILYKLAYMVLKI